MTWDNVEQAFKDLDRNEFKFFSMALASYRDSLIKEGFTRREALRLVETYSKFIYDMSLEVFMNQAVKDDVDDDPDSV